MERLIRLRQEAERIVAELFHHTADAARSGKPAGPRLPVDVYEGDEAFLLVIDLAGVAREDLSLHVVGSTLILEGEKREDFAVPRSGHPRVTFECAERAYGSFRRAIELPGAADTSQIEAKLARGVLQVKLPRIRERRGRRREVRVG